MFNRFFNMTPRRRLQLAGLLIAVPILLRGIYFYQGIYIKLSVPTPDYVSFTVPTPPGPSLNTPPAASVAAPVSAQTVVLDYAHTNEFEVSEIEPFSTALAERGGTIVLDNGSKALREGLKSAAAYVVISPTTNFTPDEIQAVRTFVAGGGRLLLLTDPTRGAVSYDFSGNPNVYPDVNAANSLAASFGLTFNNDYLYDLDKNEGNFRNVIFTQFAKDPLVSGLKQLVFYGAHSIGSEKGTALAVGDGKVFTSLTDSGDKLTPFVLGQDGQVLGVGDFTFLMTPYNAVGDNAALLDRIADFTLGGKRQLSLTNFPYIFTQDVHLLPTGDVQLTAELLGALSGLQSGIENAGLKFFIDEKAPAEGDLIVLGTFDQNDEIAPYLKPFKLDLSNSGAFLEVPGFGKVGRSGNAVLLFNPGVTGNTLVVLTDTTDDQPSLLGKLAAGDLSTCVLQGQIAVCSVGFGGGFSESTLPPPLEGTPGTNFEGGPAPTYAPFGPTPTPSG